MSIKKQQGIAVIGIVIISALVLAAVGVVGYKVYKSRQDKPVAESQQQEQPAEEEKSDLKSGLLGAEQISFSYPADWTLENKIEPSELNGVAIDRATLTAPDGLKVTMTTGLDGLGGACEECGVTHTQKVSALGKSLHINFISPTNQASKTNSIALSTASDCSVVCAILSKKVLYEGRPLAMMFNAAYPGEGANKSLPVAELRAKASVKQAIAIFDSLSY